MSMGHNLELATLESVGRDAWKSFVNGTKHATPFHTLHWKDAVDGSFRYIPKYRVLVESGTVLGVFPRFKVHGIFGSELVQPFCEYSYPLLDPGINNTDFLHKVGELASWPDTEIIKEGFQSRNTGYYEADFAGVETGVTFRLQAEGGYDNIKQNKFDPEVRRCISSSLSQGVQVIEVDSTDEYYQLYVDTMKRLASPPFHKKFYDELKSSFGDDCKILLATIDGNPIAGVLTLSADDEGIIWSSASNKDHWDKYPNHLLYARAIEILCERHKIIDFGRTEVGSGVYKFKKQFGGEEHKLVSMVAPPRRRNRASVSQYRHAEPVVKKLRSVITHEKIGPAIKEFIHE